MIDQRTISEFIFEEYCEQNNIAYTRVDPSRNPGARSADYRIHLACREVLVEVKQLNPNPEDREHQNDLDELGVTQVREVKTAQRLRKKIDDAMPQLQTRFWRFTPTLLVLYSNILLDRYYIDPFNVLTAMYGDEQLIIGLPSDPAKPPLLRAIRFGGRRKVAPTHNTTLSAIVCLHRDSTTPKICAAFYHNVFCTAPFKPSWLRKGTTTHFRVQLDGSGTFKDWEEF